MFCNTGDEVEAMFKVVQLESLDRPFELWALIIVVAYEMACVVLYSLVGDYIEI